MHTLHPIHIIFTLIKSTRRKKDREKQFYVVTETVASITTLSHI